MPDISAIDAATGQRYERALVLVRLHAQPLGLVEIQLGQECLAAQDYARQIWHALQAEITAHLRQDRLPQPEALEACGLPAGTIPLCAREREAKLAVAPFVSVVVATHDRPASLATCLRSLLSLNYPHYEIIVVDNAPGTDEAVAVVRQMRGGVADVRYLREDRPGLACAHNRGLEDVRGEIVAFTDDDVMVDPQWLAELVSGFSVAEHVGCVAGLIFPMELQTPSQLWIEQFGGFSKGFTQRVFDLSAHRPSSLLYPYAAGIFGSGANMAFRTAALRHIGGFDPALGAGSMALGGDDLAAFFEVIAAGYTLVYQPAAIVHHPHRREYAGLRKQMYGYGVALTAYLTKVLIDRPSRIPDLAARIPHGLVYALSSRSPKNARKRPDYPRELTMLERKGMLYGPLAYLRGRRQSRKAALKGGWSRAAALQPAQPSALDGERAPL
ncbi:MAG TPA: glycosyltransferase family 2 protein [Chloroflexota bacterium]|nr:glycosyltransferase family 2 protein [Chloroflexota bacterium]